MITTYTIPFTHTVHSTIKVDAHSLEDAIKFVSNLNKVDSTGKCTLIHGYSTILNSEVDLKSFKIDQEQAEKLNPNNTYEVTLRRVQSTRVLVRAKSKAEAEDIVNSNYDRGEYKDLTFSDEEVETLDTDIYED